MTDERIRQAITEATDAYALLIAAILNVAQDARAAAEIGSRTATSERDIVALQGISERAAMIIAKYRSQGPVQ
jgi:hypothetical protein